MISSLTKRYGGYRAIEVRVPGKPPATDPAASAKPSHSLDKQKLSLKQMINDAFSKEDVGKFPGMFQLPCLTLKFADALQAKQHAQKVAKKLGVQNGLIFLPGQEEKNYEDSDMGPEFHQRRYFYYLSGAGFPGCSVTYDIARDHLILWVPYMDPRNVLWYGRTPSIDDCREISAVDDVRYISGLDRFLYTALSPGSTLFVLHPEQTPKLESTKGVVHIDTVKLRPAIDAARVIKTEYEVAMIRRANAISVGFYLYFPLCLS